MNNKNISFEDAIKFAQGEEHLLKKRNNNFRLSDFQIAVLDMSKIHYIIIYYPPKSIFKLIR